MAAVKNPLETFFWGEGGAALTPEQIASRRKVENAILARGVDTSPVGHWTQGLARVADAFAGSVRRGQLDSAEEKSANLGAADYAAAVKAFGGGSSTSPAAASTIPMTSAAGEVSATSPSTGDTYAPFMDTIRTGVQNPYALAAIAATGRAESGWSAENANRTWSDPSESGQPGTAGGIMSWRGPRYQALAATGDLSPQGQAKFFLNEDPALIQKLNGAKSVEEAQQLMNNAWAFAGYNRPGGESARRLGYAKGYLPGFQGGNTEVASLDPSAGMSAPQAIEAAAPASGYVDPMVSVKPRAEAPAALPLSPPQTVAPSPAVAQVAQQVAQGPVQSSAPNPLLNEAIVKAMSSPYMSEGQRSVVDALLKQRMAEQQAARDEQNWRARQTWTQDQQRSDPAYQLDQDYKRAQLDALRGKPSKTWQKLDDTTLFNPETGETQRVNAPAPGNGGFRFEGKSVEAQALNGLMDTGTLTPAQAQQLGAGKTITGPNGEIIFMTPQGVFGQTNKDAPAQPLATFPTEGIDIFGDVPQVSSAAPVPVAAPAQRQGMIPLTEPRVQQSESNAAGFADRMTDSGALVDKFGNAGLSTVDQLSTRYLDPNISNRTVSPEFQQYDQARRDFINAQLRRESGAVISPEEFDNANRQYFPQPGDKPDVLEQKRRNRETVINAMIRDAGPTYKRKVTAAGGGDVAKPTTDEEYNALPAGALFIDPDDGKQYRK